MSRALAALLAALALAACAAPPPTARPEPRPPARPATPERPAPTPAPLPPAADVRLGGLSLVGTWAAIAVEGDAEATADLERGVLEQTLLVRPGGNVILTGVDHREGSGEPLAFGGEVRGDLVLLTGMQGAGRLSVRGRRLLLHDPRGRTTVFVRVGR